MNTALVATAPGGYVRITCGCEGTVAATYTTTKVVSVRLTVACTGHPERLAAGAIDRFTLDKLLPDGALL